MVEAITAQQVMEKLEADAGGNRTRLGTLARVVVACDDMVSGEAHKLAKKAKMHGAKFDPQFVKINSRTVHAYVKLRAHLDGPKTEWVGPWDTVIRADKDLKAYVDLRHQELVEGQPAKPKSRGARSVEVERIVDGIESLTDRQTLRFALADARKWKRDYDILAATLSRMPALNVEELLKGNASPTAVAGSASPGVLTPEEMRTLRKLVARLRDDRVLADFELMHASGAVKMDGPPGLDLVYPEEIGLLARLSGEKGSG
ncbi:hypothetical protein [Tianweitania sediminis]|uniref:Uncharacterized protein n=1 Tax=Tianweitania sediminis TaxID=1502156 RepID=A0A8J7R0U1_9HYPH|nr:hypothetical protein [Tianweitania sediminis]MBP0438055.1 hypothetical protein [Tianweitania sediminis]